METSLNGTLPQNWPQPLLGYVTLFNNQVTGSLPQSWSTNGSFQSLTHLSLANTSLTGPLHVHNCIFTNNSATQGGGAIASVNNVHSQAGNLLIGQGVLTDSAASTGGSIYGTDLASMVISNSTHISSNRAATNGGGISCEDCAPVTLQLQVAISSNQADTSGSAVFCDSCTTNVSNDTQYTQNG